jgi:hypothetical protein
VVLPGAHTGTLLEHVDVRLAAGRRLDNTLRIVGRAASAWVLVAIDVQVVGRRHRARRLSLWSEDGELNALPISPSPFANPTSRSSCAPDPFR